MWVPERTFERADRAIAQGKLWRAKEILRGNISAQEFHAELYERYGRLLLDMRDSVDAGKYLFLSGARNPEYLESIDLFLTRHGRDAGRVAGSFPGRAWSTPLEDFPPAAQEDMKELGITLPVPERVCEGGTTRKDYVGMTVCFLVGAVIAVCLLVGAGVLIRLAWTAVT